MFYQAIASFYRSLSIDYMHNSRPTKTVRPDISRTHLDIHLPLLIVFARGNILPNKRETVDNPKYVHPFQRFRWLKYIASGLIGNEYELYILMAKSKQCGSFIFDKVCETLLDKQQFRRQQQELSSGVHVYLLHWHHSNVIQCVRCRSFPVLPFPCLKHLKRHIRHCIA